MGVTVGVTFFGFCSILILKFLKFARGTDVLPHLPFTPCAHPRLGKVNGSLKNFLASPV